MPCKGGGRVATERAFNLTAIIEGQSQSRFLLILVLLSALVTFFDGLEMVIVSYLAAYLAEDLGLSSVELGAVFAAGTFGAIVGGILFGYLGYRFGRRPAIVLAVFSSAFISIALAFATSYEALMALRFLNGIALGGALPLCWMLNVEYLPSKNRATATTIVTVGYALGSSLGAPLTIVLAPDYGWEAVFAFSGITTGIVGVALLRWLPESARHLVNRGGEDRRVAHYARQIAPTADIPDDAAFYLADEADKHARRVGPACLFGGKLKWVTPLLWMAFLASSTAVYLTSNWTPLILEYLDYSRTMAASFFSISSLGAALGGLLLMRVIRRHGALSIAAMALLSLPILLVLGLAPIDYWTLLILNFFAAIVMQGAHYGMHSISGIFYPSAWRGNGAHRAASIAKIGWIAGPLIGGYFLASNLPVRHIFALLAISPLVLSVSLLLLEWQRQRDARRMHEALRMPEIRSISSSG